MKKIVSLITMAAMLAVSTPAVANGRHNDNRWGVDSNRNSPYHGRHHRNKIESTPVKQSLSVLVR